MVSEGQGGLWEEPPRSLSTWGRTFGQGGRVEAGVQAQEDMCTVLHNRVNVCQRQGAEWNSPARAGVSPAGRGEWACVLRAPPSGITVVFVGAQRAIAQG